MPELIEVEAYRRLAERGVGREIAGVAAPDPWWLKGGLEAAALAGAVTGSAFCAARRVGKLLLLDTDAGHTVGIHFGMTGRLLVDGTAGVDRLLYSSGREDPAWDRLTFRFGDGGALVVRDPRRLGGATLDPDEGRLGPDAGRLGPAGFGRALAGSSAPLKARLMDQSRVAGLGNLLVDEVLWRAGLDPLRPAGGLSPAEVRRLHRAVRAALAVLTERGGSHTGDLGPARVPGGACPRDGTPLVRRTVGGRTTWSCPRHQR